MKVSVATPVYNDRRVALALDSVFRQSYLDLESIVIDGMSDDETVAELEARSDRIRWIREPDSGIYDAFNKGVDAATGEILANLNADDRYADPDVIAKVVSAFDETGADIVYGNVEYVDSKGNVVRRWRSSPMPRREFRSGWMPPHPTCFVRRQAFDRVGPFDTQFRIAADYDWLLRAFVVEGVKTHWLDETLVRMAPGGTSNASIRNIVNANREVARSWRKNGLPGGWAAPILKPLRKPFQFVRRP